MLWHGNECGENKSSENLKKKPSFVTIRVNKKQLHYVE
jgi:hypothetical protein